MTSLVVRSAVCLRAEGRDGHHHRPEERPHDAQDAIRRSPSSSPAAPITGGAFKLGGLKALDDFLVNRKTTDFDTYVGLSAGAVLAAPLAGGVTRPR